MPTTAQTFFPHSTDQDQAFGTDVRKLDDAIGALLSTTIAQHPNAAGTTDITLDPYTSRNTQGDFRDSFGWAWDEASADGMDSNAGARRVIPAGTWTFTNRVSIPQAATGTGRLTVSLLIRLYRVASGGGTRTTIATFTSDTVESLGTSIGGVTGTLTATGNPGEIILEPGETLHVGYMSHMVQVAGLAGATVAGNATYHTGAQGGVNVDVEVASPGVRTVYAQSGSDSISLQALLANRKVGLSRSVSISLTTATSKYILLAAKQASLSLTTVVAKWVRKAPLETSLSLSTAISKLVRPSAKASALTFTTGISRYVKPVAKSVTLTLTTAFARRVEAARAFSANLTLTTAFSRAVIAVRSFTAQLTLVGELFVKIKQDILNRLEGGTSTIIRKFFPIFPD